MYNVNYLNLCDFSTPCSAKLSLLCVIGIQLTSLAIHSVEVDGELIHY